MLILSPSLSLPTDSFRNNLATNETIAACAHIRLSIRPLAVGHNASIGESSVLARPRVWGFPYTEMPVAHTVCRQDSGQTDPLKRGRTGRTGNGTVPILAGMKQSFGKAGSGHPRPSRWQTAWTLRHCFGMKIERLLWGRGAQLPARVTTKGVRP